MKKFLVFVALLIATFITVSLTSDLSVSAAARDEYFLGMPAWDNGIDLEGINSTDAIKQGIVLIVSNILTAITVASAYLVLGYTIYGGYLYMFANGDAGKAAGGKKTLTRAFIGLAVVGSAYIILNAIRFAFMGNAQKFDNCKLLTGSNCVTAESFLGTSIGWFIGIAGVIASIFLVVGGIGYVTSAGDSGKLQKAKNTIMYSLIGLAVVGLSQIIVAFVTNMVNDSTSFINQDNYQTLISKEYHEK